MESDRGRKVQKSGIHGPDHIRDDELANRANILFDSAGTAEPRLAPDSF
jgi:hypothetical protein